MTVFTLSVSGGITPAGTLTQQAQQTLTGSQAPSGALTNKVAKSMSGSTTPTGTLRSIVAKFLSGSTTPTGVVTLFGRRYESATVTRLRTGVVTGRRLVSLTATALRTRAGRAFSQTTNPASAGLFAIRWRFDDPVTGDSYVFDINPVSGGSATGKKTVTSTQTTAADGQPINVEGDRELLTGQFEGTVRTQAQYQAMRTWLSEKRPLQLTDDLMRRSIVVLVSVRPKRKYTGRSPWKQDVTVTYRILSRTDV